MRAHTKFKKNGKIEEYFFKDPKEIIQYPTKVEDALDYGRKMQDKGYYAVFAVTYEKDEYILMIFDKPVSYEAFLGDEKSLSFSMSEPSLSETQEEIEDNIEQVRNYIKDGHTYQVNYTTRFYGDFSGDSHQLFLQLSSKNNGDYAMYIDTGEKEILSLSPELFFELDSDLTIRAKPMKGTAPRFTDPDKDRESYEFLRHSKKDQAENVMIVDLLRNDISKVAEKNSVRAVKLFTIEKYQTVYQMISTVEAKVKEDLSLGGIFNALFPCGSITGAPKIMTMSLIEKLEKTKRGYYCGALGVLYPDQAAIFNVPIRTLVIEDNRYTYAAGGGITYDSNPKSEFEEILHKTSFLKQGQYDLLESMRLEEGEVKRLALHQERLNKSASFFGFQSLDLEKVTSDYVKENNILNGLYKLRLSLAKSGEYSLSHQAIEDKNSMTAEISHKPIQAARDFLSNKTSIRHHYIVESSESELVLYYNDEEVLTEFNIGNLVIEEDNHLYTPDSSVGLLDGVMRQALIKAGKLQLRNYNLDEFKKKYETNQIKLYMINSVREIVPVVLQK